MRNYFGLIFMVIALLWFTMVAVGCSTFSKDIPRISPDMKTSYRWDLIFEINEKKFIGVATPKIAKRYKIRVYNRNIDIMRYTGCSRQGKAEKQDKWSVIKNKGKDQKYYIPIPKLEDGINCNLFVEVYDNEMERHHWGMIMFSHPKYNLQGTLKCNGRVQNSAVLGCAAKVGLEQMVEFPELVYFFQADDAPKACELEFGKMPRKSLKFKVPSSEKCYYEVMGAVPPYREAKFLIAGYELILPRQRKTKK